MASLADPNRDAVDAAVLNFLNKHPANDMTRNGRAQAVASSAPTTASE